MGLEEERELPDAELSDAGGKPRLFVEAPLGPGVSVQANESQAHYLLRVMRAKADDHVRLFNGRAGEWRARVTDVSRRGCSLRCETQLLPQNEVPDLWFVFAPIKRTPADYVTQKATELGARLLQPVITHRTVARRVNLERMRANAIEAAEQSGRLSVPAIRAPSELPALLDAWPRERRLVFCDEAGDALPIAEALERVEEDTGAWGILTGPEGGFDDSERTLIRQNAFVLPVTLGPRIMRADTAALAAIAIWQSRRGDWL
jgi:16S rRNA (uracil1498-N3)-methyltransferase